MGTTLNAVRLPHDGGSKGLHFHGVPEEMNGEQVCHPELRRCFRIGRSCFATAYVNTVGQVECPLWVDTVEKVVSDPPKRNNRIRTASYLNRNCVRGRDFESMLRIRGRKIVFQQYRSKAEYAVH